MLKLLLFVVLLIVLLYGMPLNCLAAEAIATDGFPKTQKKSSGGYCGVYCLYAAMKYFGVETDPNELLKPEYIGSARGNSLAELKKAAEKHGLYAMPIDRLTTKDLRKLFLPLIIHVKSSPTGKKYDHYFLFLDSIDGQALIYDPPNPIEPVEFWTLARAIVLLLAAFAAYTYKVFAFSKL